MLIPTDFITKQLTLWDHAALNYAALGMVETKELNFGGCRMLVTHNPGRIRSSAAKVDAHSVAQRKCFLCGANRPKEQLAFPFGEYEILMNPYPIFRQHLTIVSREHVDQKMTRERMEDMLTLAQGLDGYTIFYNGPRCGASAPDHLHFQAGIRKYMPVEEEIMRVEMLSSVIGRMPNYVRKMFVIHSKDKDEAITEAIRVIEACGIVIPREPEPMVNILVWYDVEWRICIFPRREHRPVQFFAEGEQQILFSPGSVDFGGVLVIPRKEDYQKLNIPLVEDMFGQLTITDKEERMVIDMLGL